MGALPMHKVILEKILKNFVGRKIVKFTFFTHLRTWAGGGGYCTPPLIRRIGGKINGPIRIWEAAQAEFVVKICIRIHKLRTNSYFDFSPVDVFFYRQ